MTLVAAGCAFQPAGYDDPHAAGSSAGRHVSQHGPPVIQGAGVVACQPTGAAVLGVAASAD